MGYQCTRLINNLSVQYIYYSFLTACMSPVTSTRLYHEISVQHLVILAVTMKNGTCKLFGVTTTLNYIPSQSLTVLEIACQRVSPSTEDVQWWGPGLSPGCLWCHSSALAPALCTGRDHLQSTDDLELLLQQQISDVVLQTINIITLLFNHSTASRFKL